MRIIRLKEVIDSTGLARSTIYKYIGCTTGSWQGLRSAT